MKNGKESIKRFKTYFSNAANKKLKRKDQMFKAYFRILPMKN